MENEENKKNEFYEPKYNCEICDFKCCYISDWKRHLSTSKHLVSKDGNKMEKNGNGKILIPFHSKGDYLRILKLLKSDS